MAKLCPAGKAAAKKKFKVYPSAYANIWASKYCKGKVGRTKKANGGSAMAGKKKFPDLTGDGKVTRADVLKGRGVFNKGGRATSVMGRGQGKVIKHKKTIMV